MLRATILARTNVVDETFLVACREGTIIAELNPWWPQLTDRFGIVLNSANDNYRLALRKT